MNNKIILESEFKDYLDEINFKYEEIKLDDFFIEYFQNLATLEENKALFEEVL